MDLPLSRTAADRLVILAEAGSTNDELVARAAGEPDFSVLVTDNQTDGRGRLGRVWLAPSGTSLAISVLLRPTLPGGEPLALQHFGWLPLIAGAAMATALQSLVPGTVGLKWPNDVQVDGLKVCGVLAELVGTGDAVVIGAGVNLAQTRDQLPTPVSTSLALAGAVPTGDSLADAVLSAYLTALRGHYDVFLHHGADVAASGTLALVTGWCTTLGQQVRVELPGGDDLLGTAVGIDESGRVQVRAASDGAITAVAAGDVTHLRYE